jgi:ABC-type siderophore export system fused ATPase/permease subunit
VTHDSRVFQFADHIAHMDDGRIVETSAASRPAQPIFAGVN